MNLMTGWLRFIPSFVLKTLCNFAGISITAMTDSFPYPLLNRKQLTEQLNQLAALRTPFLFMIDYNAEQGYVIKEAELDATFIQFQFESQQSPSITQNPKRGTRNTEPETCTWDIKPLSQADYKQKFDYVQRQIHLGNSFLVNLTQPTSLKSNYTLLEIFHQSRAKYKLWIKDSMLVLSPETFITIEGQILSSYPMKGTIDAMIPNAMEIILNDPKELAEHATIVDLIRNDMSKVSDDVTVKRYRYVEKIKTNKFDLYQVSSKISGTLPTNFRNRLGEILFELLPAGSICGAPKTKTLEIIQSAEGYDRGFYSGICGLFDGENLDSGVMIRFIEQNGEELIFKSGGGITSRSEMINEYEELIQKVYVPIC
jgi:para-aminobenzoate synthetase component 1